MAERQQEIGNIITVNGYLPISGRTRKRGRLSKNRQHVNKTRILVYPKDGDLDEICSKQPEF